MKSHPQTALAARPASEARPSHAVAPAPDIARYVIPNLRNACRVLKLLGQESGGLKVIDISRALTLPVTTTLRIMSTLQLEGFVRKDGGDYHLGPVLIQLGHASLARTEIREVAQPILESLSIESDETAHLAVPCDGRSLIVAVQDSPHPLRAASRPGFLAELHCSSTGKVFLAYLYEGRVPGLAPGEKLTRRTPHTVVSHEAIRREAAQIRTRGYSVDDEEFNLGVRCVAAPVFGSQGTVVAAVGVTAAAVRLTREKVPDLARKVAAAARTLSHRIGHAERDP